MTEVHQYWTNQKEAVPVAVVAMVEVLVEAEVEAEAEAEVAAAVAILEGVDLLDWEDCSRLECRS